MKPSASFRAASRRSFSVLKCGRLSSGFGASPDSGSSDAVATAWMRAKACDSLAARLVRNTLAA